MMQGVVKSLQESLGKLGSWAGMGGSSEYIRPHVTRKIAALVMANSRQTSPGTRYGQLWTGRVGKEVLDLASPDVNKYTEACPSKFTTNTAQWWMFCRGFNVDPLYITMWACFFGTGLKLLGSKLVDRPLRQNPSSKKAVRLFWGLGGLIVKEQRSKLIRTWLRTTPTARPAM